MSVTRRGFLQLLGGAVVAAAAPIPSASSAAIPKYLIVGDGVHDDAAGLNALMRGEIVEFVDMRMGLDCGWNGNLFQMPTGVFRISEPIKIGGTKEAPWEYVVISGSGSEIKADDCTALEISHSKNSDFCHFTIKGASCAIHVMQGEATE